MSENNNVIDNRSGQENVTITVTGRNNRVILEPIAKLISLNIEVRGDSNFVHIKQTPRIGSLRMIVRDRSKVIIGKYTTFEQAYLLAEYGSGISIGEDCMVSFQVDMRTSDAHGIYELESGERLNPPMDIVIGNHVWIGQAAMIAKGTHVGDHSVIGFRAHTQKIDIPPNSICAGVPARVVRSGVIWDRKNATNIFTCAENEVDMQLLQYPIVFKMRAMQTKD